MSRSIRSLSLAAAILAATALLATPLAAQPPAGECLIGPGLAATLLYPYFEVDPGNINGLTTVLSVNNGLAVPAMARVILWTDWGVPTIAFDVYLDGFDVQTINLRDVFNGNIPSTGGGADLSGFEFCGILPPFHANPVLTQDEIDQLNADHRGVVGPLAGDCAGSVQADGRVRGYITADVVDECSGVEGFLPSFTPATPDGAFPYFVDGGSGDGIAIADNVLWGDIAYVDPAGGAAQGSEAVAIWASPGQFTDTDIFTFYGRFSGFDGRDERVPLPRLWDQRFLNGGPFAGGASLIVWRDSNAPGVETAACGDEPSFVPLGGNHNALDEAADNLFAIDGDAFPLMTQRTDVGGLGIPYAFGWIQIDTELGQSWVQPTLTGAGLFSAAANGFPVAFLCDLMPPAPPVATAPSPAVEKSDAVSTGKAAVRATYRARREN